MINPDSLIERSKLKKQVSFWRNFFFLAVIIAIIAASISFPSIDNIKSIESGKLGKGEDFIARINVEGMILKDSEREDIIKKISEDDKIKAVILNVNSPGGSAVGGETLYNAIKELNEKKPVVTVFNSIATSAAYMISLGSEHIIAHNGTITGSIGVIMEIPNFKKLSDKIGVDFKYIRTSPLKGAPTLFDEPNPEAFDVLEGMMNDFYKFFIKIVAEEREISENEAKLLADGRVFSGLQAKRSGLVDAIGGEKDALEWLFTKKKLDKSLKIREVKLYKPESPLDKILGAISESLSLESFFENYFSEKGLYL